MNYKSMDLFQQNIRVVVMENKLYRAESQKDLFLIGFSYDNVPIGYSDINEWLAAITLFPDYIIEIPISDIVYEYDILKYQHYLENFSKVDYIILDKRLTNLVPKDNTDLLRKYCIAYKDMVEQYLSGKDRVINQLMGVILKENKGLDPKSLKIDLDVFINKEYRNE